MVGIFFSSFPLGCDSRSDDGVMAQPEFFGPDPKATGPGEAAAPGSDGPGPGATRAAPLAARMRPRNLDEYAGQRHILGPGQSC